MKGSIQASNDIACLESFMMDELDRLPPMSPSRCIFRVPDRLRRVCEQAYTPRVISIGPLHHGKEALIAMEEHKKRYLQYFLLRTNYLSLKECIMKIRDQEAKLRSCYSEILGFESDEFVRMILVDAIFVIEFLFRCSYPKLTDGKENDCIFGEPHMGNDIWPDLLMLENQLPFFILQDLFDPATFEYSGRLNGVESLSILFLSYYFLNNCGTTFLGRLDNLETIYVSEVQHLVDLLRKLCIAPILKEVQSAGQYTSVTTAPSIEELHLAGVKFKARSTQNLFDIRFRDGILEIPNLKTEDTTELILRNLVAFEQCRAFEERYISDYVSIMDQFVNTPEDVELLVKYRIIENYLGGGSNGLSTMINSLSAGVSYDSYNFCYGLLCKDLNKFCSSKLVAPIEGKFETKIFRCRIFYPHTHCGSNILLNYLSLLALTTMYARVHVLLHCVSPSYLILSHHLSGT